MPSSASDWITSLLTVGLIVLSAAYCVVSTLIARARRRHGAPVPGVYPGSPEHQAALEAAGVDSMAEWRQLPTIAQEVADECALAEHDAVQAVTSPEWAARVAARDAVERLRVNALFHP